MKRIAYAEAQTTNLLKRKCSIARSNCSSAETIIHCKDSENSERGWFTINTFSVSAKGDVATKLHKSRSNHASSVATVDELGKTDNEILTLKIPANTHITKRIAGVECARQVRSASLLWTPKVFQITETNNSTCLTSRHRKRKCKNRAPFESVGTKPYRSKGIFASLEPYHYICDEVSNKEIRSPITEKEIFTHLSSQHIKGKAAVRMAFDPFSAEAALSALASASRR
jgi:hypothetical protein